LVDSAPAKLKANTKSEPILSGGRTIYPGRVSGPACLAEDVHTVARAPDGAIVFVRRPSPELVGAFTRIGGLVAEWGNVAGHSAALLREFKLPSVFLMPGAFEQLKTGDPVSLDAVRACVYPGDLWPRQNVETPVAERSQSRKNDPLNQRVLALNLIDASALNFRPSGCRSVHDVIRFCHEQGVRTMFTVNDLVADRENRSAKRLQTSLPVDVFVLDLGGGLALDSAAARTVRPEEVVSRPFQYLWKGLSHPGVTWARQMPASIKDIASVMASSLTPPSGSTRMLGEKSYLLAANDYLNFNSRLAFHFTLVDACLADVSSRNYIAFRFAGGGATWRRRILRASFIELCLAHYGFHVDRRGDLVNAWYKRAPAEDTGNKLDILGRLMVCTCQLDMYMQSYDVMKWYVQQFIEGNYSFQP
jgi:pyruvate,water dikinase